MTDDAKAILELASRLGHFPKWRTIKRELNFGSSRVSRARSEAFDAWDGDDPPNRKYLNKQRLPHVVGVTADEPIDTEALWEAAIKASNAYLERQAERKNQSITFPDEPFALALFGDTHTGAAGTNYQQLKEDAELVADTDGMYALFGGDGTNNWLVGRLKDLQRHEIMPHASSWHLFLDWLSILGDKLVAVVEGNHDRWSHKVSGFSPIADHLRGALVLHDSDEMVFKLECGELNQRWMVRHSWRWSSVFNPTHGQEVMWQRGDVNFDVAVGFHTHNGTLFRPFIRHGRRRLAAQMGTYKTVDAFAKERGFPSPPTLGCGAFVGHPDGRWWTFESLSEAAEFLGFLRAERAKVG